MDRQVALEVAAAELPRLIDELQSGDQILITKEGKPGARLTPVRTGGSLRERRAKAMAEALEIMREGWSIGAGPLDRDEIHER